MTRPLPWSPTGLRVAVLLGPRVRSVVLAEERYLEAKCGDEYREYSSRVRFRFAAGPGVSVATTRCLLRTISERLGLGSRGYCWAKGVTQAWIRRVNATGAFQ